MHVHKLYAASAKKKIIALQLNVYKKTVFFFHFLVSLYICVYEILRVCLKLHGWYGAEGQNWIWSMKINVYCSGDKGMRNIYAFGSKL